MEDNSLDSSDLNLLSKSLSIVQRDAILKNTEQAYLFVQFNSGGGAFLHTAGGNSISTEFPPIKTIENVVIEPSLSGVSSIRVIHTHPASFFQGSIPPSLNDLLLADDISNNNPKTMYYHDVADFGGMWEYSVSPSSVFGQAAALIKENMKKILALPEVQGKVSLNKCSPVAEVVGVFESSLNAVYGISAQTMAREMNKKANEAMDPFYEQDSRLRSTASDDERKSIFKERESLERSLGISLKYTQM